ncbi:hypothetical protein [Pseudomonas putida]|uniref:Ig-like domain-containing protein n=1 Tax=Pseudomonas putida TaxID=303 RepID=A0A1B2F3N1_PSEPU|nr:hypothetical protein [Pseudomonas putida]ANY86815.1 hypothetical protein IEC33019_1247 [Pseudomonas putida]
MNVINAQYTGSDLETRGHNLVQDPSFPVGSISANPDAETSWKISKPGGFAHYQGPYVGIWGDRKLWQIIELPVVPAAEGRPDYWLSCEYDATYYEACWLRVYDADNEGEPFFTHTLYGQPPRPQDLQEEHFVNWHTMSEMRIAVPAQVRRLRVQFETPAEGSSYLFLRNVTTHLRLPAFDESSDVQLLVERPGESPIVQSTRPFRLCRGATHQLKVKAPTGNAWDGQKTSLLWLGEGVAPPIQYGLTATPDINYRDADDEEYYLPLSSEDGASWTLTAGAKIPEGLPVDITLGLGSYWQAEKHPIAAQMGDFHHLIEKVEWDGVVPVASEKNATVLTATVKNPFAPDRPMEGKEVVWSYNGKNYPSKTDGKGQAKLTYTPALGDAGEANQVVFTASCQDALQHPSSVAYTCPVFDESPWLEQIEATLDGKPIADLKTMALRLTRGVSHTLVLKANTADSYFVGKDIALSWPEGKPLLGITLEPNVGVPQTMDMIGISWTITGGADTSGSFTLHAEETADAGLKVPLSLPGVQLSANLADEAELKVAAAGTDGLNIFRRGTDRALSLVPRAGSPLADAKLQGWMTFIERDLTQDKVAASPAYDAKVDIGANTTWTLKGAAVSGLFGVQVHVEGLQPLALDNAMLLSLDLNDEAELKIGGAAVPSPTIFRRATAQTVSFVARSGSPLKAAGLEYWLAFDTSGTLAETDVTAVPAYKERYTNMSSPAWKLTGGAVSGTFGVQLHMAGFTTPLKLSNALLLSLNLHDELDLTVDGVVATGSMIFRRKVERKISFQLKKSSPLGQSKLKYKLVFDDSGSLTAQQVAANPAYGKEYNGYTGPLWTVTGQDVSGTFGLQLQMEGFTTPYKTGHWLLLSEKVDDEYDLTTKDAVVEGVAHFWRGKAQAVTLKPKATSPLSKGQTFNGQLKFVVGKGVPQDKVQAQPGYDQPAAIPVAGHTWTLTGKDVSGTFGLQVSVEGFKTPAQLATNVLMSTKLADEAQVTLDGSDKISPAIFRRSTAGKVLLKPRSGSPLGSTVTPKAWLAFITTGATLTAAQVPAAPKYTEQRSMVAAGLEWLLTGANVSGLFGVGLHVTGFDPITLGNCGLLSPSMTDEMSLRASWRNDLPPGLMSPEHTTVVYAPSSPLVKLGAQLRLDFLPEGASCILKERPARGEWVKMTDAGRVKWLLTGSVMERGWVQGRITSTLFPDVWKLPAFYVGWNLEEVGAPPEDQALVQQGVIDVCPR